MIDEEHELLIQKCVDGELDTQTQQQLLAQLDVLTEGWKLLALAYVEEQTWNQSFQENNRVAAELEAQAFVNSVGAMVEAEAHEVQCFRPANPSGDSDRRSRLLTQATCLAIALVGGVLIGDVWRARQGASTGLVDNRSEGSDSNTIPDGGSNLVGNGVMLDVPNGSGGSLQVPVYPLDRYHEHSEPDLRSREMRRELLRFGLDLDEDQKLIFLELEDGRRALMPWTSYKLSPIGQ